MSKLPKETHIVPERSVVQQGAVIEFYYFATSYWSRIVAIALHEKGLEPTRHVVDITSNANFAPEYMQINPRGVVPTLVVDGTPICDAPRIVAHLDEIAMPKMRSTDEAGQHWEHKMAQVPIEMLSYATWVLGRRGEKSAGILDDKIQRAERLAATHPALADRYLAKRDHFLEFRQAVYSEDKVQDCRDLTARTLADAAQVVAYQPWLSGDEFGYADALAASILFRLADLGEGNWHRDPRHPLVVYYERIRARPSHAAVFVDDPNIPQRYRTDGTLQSLT